LRFIHNRLERLRSDTCWEILAKDVSEVRVRRKLWLVVEATSGTETFRVFGAAEVAPRLKAALAAPAAAAQADVVARRDRTPSQVHHGVVVAVSEHPVVPKRGFRRISEGVCRRAFSSPEAFLYELTIAEALCDAVLPVLRQHVQGRRVLDVGAGGGRLAVALAEGRAVTGVDPSWAQVRRFKRRVGNGAAIVRAEGAPLPFRSGSFDTVYSSCVFKHWRKPVEALRDCGRVARPGGTLITVEIDGAASELDFWRFAESSRVPLGLRSAYVRFAMRTVVGVAPTRCDLEYAFNELGMADLAVDQFSDMPFLIATATIV
jgi:SAM-dependent methyltransferase